MAQKPYDSREITRQLEKELLEDFGETAFAILRNLIGASPVGNPTLWKRPVAPPGYVGGHFRRNWLVSVGGPNTTEIEGVDRSGAPTLAAGKAEIRRGTNRRRIRGLRLFIQNNVPYAGRLAAGGFSVQEPAKFPGWVDDAIELGLAVPGGTKDLD